MKKLAIVAVAGGLLLSGACTAKKKAADGAEGAATKPVAVSTAAAITREVPADFQETGTFVADESSDIAPLVAGRVISTPVDVGAHVTQGQIICELDHRDAELKLEQARAQLQEATAGVRQAQSRIGWVSGAVRCQQGSRSGGGTGELSIRAGAGEAGGSGLAALRQSGSDRRRVAKRIRESAHAGGNSGSAGQCGEAAIRSRGQRRAAEFRSRFHFPGFARKRQSAAGSGGEGRGRYHDSRAVRRIHHGAAGGGRRIRGA